MKIKRSLLSLCTLLTTLMMWAGPVSQEQACEVARQWLSTQNGAMRRSAAMLPLEVKTVMGATDERQQPLLYAVNIGQQQGYVVVSGEGGYFDPGRAIRGHEFHYSDSTDNGNACKAVKPGGRSWDCMVIQGRITAGYPHLYYRSDPAFAEAFVRECRKFREEAIQ